jgi:hypothetical protein
VDEATSAGQLCTKPGLVFVPETPGTDRFLAAIRCAAASVPAAPILSEHIREAYDSGLRTLHEHPDVTVAGSGVPDPSIAQPGVAHVFVTAAEAWLRDPVLAQEIFGPTSLVVRVPGPSHLAAITNRLEGQLTATVHVTLCATTNSPTRPSAGKHHPSLADASVFIQRIRDAVLHRMSSVLVRGHARTGGRCRRGGHVGECSGGRAGPSR